jgi:repressor LexA
VLLNKGVALWHVTTIVALSFYGVNVNLWYLWLVFPHDIHKSLPGIPETGYNAGDMSFRDRNILTQTQKETLDAIKRYIAVAGKSPTLEELAEKLGVKLPTVADRVRVLLRKGYLYRSGREWRNLRVNDHAFSEESRMVSVPLTFSVGADNMAVFAEYEFGQFMQIPKRMLDGRRNVFSVRVVGSSMRDAGIPDGSFVLAEESDLSEAKTGDLVIAILGEMIVLKRFVRASTGIILEPQNTDARYQPIFVQPNDDSFKIIGKYIDVIRVEREDDEEWEIVPEGN